MSRSKTILFAGLSVLIAAFPFISAPPIIAVPIFIAWCVFVSAELGGMLAFAGMTLLLTVWYLIFNLVPGSISLATVFISIATLAHALNHSDPSLRQTPLRMTEAWRTRIRSVDPYAAFLFAGVLIGDGILLRTFLVYRTSMALSSPWNVLPVAIFFLFFVTSLILLLLSREKNRSLTIVATSIHIFTALSVASIVYGVGFGFDAFLHRAAEEALFKTGSILPKTPLYTGQYVLVAALGHLTHLPIRLIDIWLVPVMTAIVLPGVYVGEGPRPSLTPPTWLLFPFAALTFTVPYNLTVMYALWLIAGWVNVRADTEVGPYRVAGMIALAVLGVFTHPLLGLPMTIVTGYVMFTARGSTHGSTPTTRTVLTVGTVAAVGLSVPMLMFIYNRLQGVALAATNPFSRLDYFTGLFRDPFPPAYGTLGPYWDLFYNWNFLIPLVFSVAVGIFVYAKGTEDDKQLAKRLAVLVSGIFIVAFLLSTMFTFKDVIVFEQSEYALRLLHAIPLLLSPLAAIVITRRGLSTTNPYTGFFALVLAALAMTASWYFSYPQENPKVQIAGPSVSSADVKAVHRIDEDAKGEPYIVLSNQMTSAAAIQEFSFRDYVQSDAGQILWYAIPTGGPLYEYFSQMTYVQPSRDLAEHAGAFAHVKIVYYLVYRYWPGYDYIANLAGQEADKIIRIDKGDIILFKFNITK